MREDLYLPIQKFSLRFRYFLFFDTKPYLADQLFIRHKVRVWFGNEYESEDSPYIGIFCRVKKQDVPEFLAALQELKRSMLICGHTDYETTISNLLKGMEQMKGAMRHGEDDSPGKTEQGQTA